LRAGIGLFGLFGLAGCAPSLIRVSDRQTVSVAEMLDDIREKRLIYMGEIHDRSAHHDLQLDVIRRLHDSGVPVAVGLEMFQYPSQAILDAWTGGNLDRRDFAAAYAKNWENVPWSLYGDIFEYARENRIPLVALNLPRGIVRRVFREGIESLTEKEKAELPPVSCDTDERYRALILKAYPGHGDGGAALRLCEAQLLWNRAMAQRLAEYAKGHPGMTVVVLAGGGHVRRMGGIPEETAKELRRAVGQAVVMPVFPPEITPAKATSDDADYLIEEETSLLRLLGGY
jgi:uncharacterized iron-regulated protein